VSTSRTSRQTPQPRKDAGNASTREDRANVSEDARAESRLEQLDRNTVELLNELRVAATGIQVLFAFLLIVPFNVGFTKLSSFDRYEYFATLLCIATSTVLLIAPSIHHRLLFRLGQKPYLVETANRVAIIALGFMVAGFTGILVLISDVLFGGVTAGIVGVLVAVGVTSLWFGLPLRRRRSLRRFHAPASG
jgi:Family of unknown function (DUF6328)